MSEKETKQEEVKDLNKERDEVCIPIAKEIVKYIGETDVAIGLEVTDEERIACYEPLYVKIMEKLKEENVLMKDIAYIFSLVLQPFSFTKDLMDKSLELNNKKSNGIAWGIEDTDELRIQDIDDMLMGKYEKPRLTVEKVAEEK